MSTREEIIEKKLKKLDDFFYHGSVGSFLLGARHGQEGVADVNWVAEGEMKSFDKCEIHILRMVGTGLRQDLVHWRKTSPETVYWAPCFILWGIITVSRLF